MKLSDSDVRDFQRLWKQETGQDLDPETARGHALSIIGLVDSVAQWKRSRARDPPS